MTILFVLNSTSTTGGGTKSFLLLVKGLIAKGHKALVVVPDDGELYAVLRRDGIKTYVLRYMPTIYPSSQNVRDVVLFLPRLVRYSIWGKQAVKSLVEICKENHVDLIHTNVSIETIGLRAARALDIPHIMHFREYADKDFNLHYFPSKRLFYSMIDSKKSYAICITKGIKEYHKFNSNRIRQIYNAIASDAHSEDKRSAYQDSQRYFLYAGRIEPAKGVMELLEAFKDAKEKIGSEILLKLAGDVNDQEYMFDLQRFISKHALEKNVEFLGSVKDMTPLFHGALALIVPSWFEAFGRCLPEAMLSGCLTIGRNTAGTKEQFDNGKEIWGKEIGFRFSTKEELTSHIVDISQKEYGHYDEIRNLARKTVEQLYNVHQYVDNIEAFYKEIVR